MKAFESFRLDEVNQCLWQGETRVSLMPKPFAVLRYLIKHPGRLVTQDELLTAIWPDTYVQPEVLRRYILEIRRALGDAADQPRFIKTFPKRGYEFIASLRTEPESRSSAADGAPSQLVGRQSELTALERYFEKTLRGDRQLVFVVGEPGIGKTSLVDAFQELIATKTNAYVARGQSVEGFAAKEPYYPIFEAVNQLARSAPRAALVDTLAAHAPTWLIQFPALVPPERHAALQRDSMGATRDRMVRELCEAFEVITRTAALVLVIEDLHWADRSSLDLLSALARRRTPAKLLVVGTFRPADLIVSDSPLKSLRHDLLLHHLSHELPLEPLQEADVLAFLANQFATGDLPPGLATIVHRHSDGNPLFMTAMLDHLRQQRVLTGADGRWTLTVPLEQVDPGVPETLKQMLEIQLQHLSESDQQLLKCAAVAGQHFTAWSAATLLESDLTACEEQCAALAERQQFLKSRGTRQLSDGTTTSEYEFRHALYRQVLYRRLTPSRRIQFHQHLAAGLERLRSPVDPELASELALHCEEGHAYERAIGYLKMASRNAMRRFAHAEAIAMLEHAREILPHVAAGQWAQLELEIDAGIGNAYYASGDIDRSRRVYEEMATRASKANLLAAQVDDLARSGYPVESIPFLLRAVEIDPSFATAYTTLSRIYSTLGDAERGRAYAKLAYERRQDVTERERLSITYQYHFEVTGDQSRANETLETWKQAFPDEFQPVNALALAHNFLGRFEDAVDEGREAVRRNACHGYPYSNLAQAYFGLGRFDDARMTAERAVALGIETLPTRRLLYQLAVLSGDANGAREHVDWTRDKPREFDMLGARAQVAAWSGQVTEARELYEAANRLAETRNLADVGTNHLAWATWMEFAYGNTARALAQARRVLSRQPGYDPRLRAALTLAMTGGSDEAGAIARQMASEFPEHTFINSVFVPLVKAGVALAAKQPTHALTELDVVAPFELGFVAAMAPLYLRAAAYLMAGDSTRATAEFQRLLAHRGSDPFSPFHALAPLGIARARRMTGDKIGAAEAYEVFLTAWAQADPAVPVLVEARHEYAALERHAPAKHPTPVRHG